MGEAGHIASQFRRSLEAGNFEAARLLAFEMPRIALTDALALTLLAAECGSPSFVPMARRWHSRLLAEARPSLATNAVVGQLLADVAEGLLHPSKALDPLQRAALGRRLG